MKKKKKKGSNNNVECRQYQPAKKRTLSERELLPCTLLLLLLKKV
jgi:hypothetical protein